VHFSVAVEGFVRSQREHFQSPSAVLGVFQPGKPIWLAVEGFALEVGMVKTYSGASWLSASAFALIMAGSLVADVKGRVKV
jgi:hypothetical protein